MAPRLGRARDRLFLLAVAISALLAAELVVIATVGQDWRGRPPTLAGWAFEVVVAGLLVTVGRSEALGRRRMSHLVGELDTALASISALTETSLSSLQLDELLQQLLGRLREVMGAELTTILVFGTDDQLVSMASSIANGARLPSLSEPTLGPALGRAAAAAREAGSLAGIAQEPELLGSLARWLGSPPANIAACPIIVDEGIYGLCVARSSSAAPLDARDRHLLQVVADRSAMGIERTRLNDAEQASSRNLERARRHTTLLADASGVLSGAHGEFEESLSGLAEVAVPVFASWCAIDLVAPQGGLRRLASRQAPGATASDLDALALRQPALEALARRVCDAGGPALLLEYDAGLLSNAAGDSEPESAGRFVSGIVVGIPVNSGLLGVITFAHGNDVAYDESDLTAAGDFARRTGVAIEGVLLYREARDSAEQSRRVASQLQRLIEITLHLPQPHESRDVLEGIAHHACAVFEAELAIASMEVVGGAPIRALASAELSAPAELAGLAAWDEQAAGLSGVRADVQHLGDWLAVSIGVPTRTPRATLAIRKGAGEAFRDEDESVLVLLAQTAAAALGNAELYASVQRSESRWRTLVETAPIGIVEVDRIGQIWWWNRAASELFCWAGALGVGRPAFPAAMELGLKELWGKLAAEDEVLGRELLGVIVDGVAKDLAVSLAPLVAADGIVHGTLTLVADITDQRRLEADLRQAHRMEAVGKLAGSVAHDFNNLLTLLSGYSELLRREIVAGGRAHELVGEIEGVTGRAAALTGQLLTIGRHHTAPPVVLSPMALLGSLTEVLERIVGSRIVLRFELGGEAANVRIDEGGFEQVVLNLAINARDAMPNGGSLSILVEDLELEGSRATLLGIPGGQYVRIAVSDDGLGMDEETCARCFEPFFTTKGPRGTGLGLPAVRGVIHAGGGAISVTSKPGRGSTFEVLLPAVKERRGAERGARPASPPGSPETILVADDDAELRRLMSRVLVRSGYRVLEAATGAGALDLAAQAEAGIDLVVTDVVMPGMSGPELVGLLRRNSPLLSVLFVSGSAKEADLTGATEGRVAYLRKPFLPSELVLSVRWALEERARSGV